MVRACAVALAVGVLGALHPAPVLADACDSSGYTGARRVVRTPKSSGYEMTAVYGDGVYHVSRCDAAGQLVEGQTVAPISEPDGKVALVPSTYSTPQGDASVLYGDPKDPVWARAWNAGGERVKDSVLPPPRGVDVNVPMQLPTPGAGAAQARAAQANDACRNGAFVRYGPTAFWSARRYSYRINGASFGNIAATRRSIVAGHRTWDDTRNDCHFRDQSNIVSGYLGLTTRRARSAADGLSVIDKGEVANIARCGKSTTAVACSWLQPGQDVGPFTENDQRYDDDYTFSNGAARAGAYDYWHISAHESGHSIGLDHSSASPFLTMYPQAAQAATFWRTLALGDVLGMRNIYP
ncbi:MAG: hypothetical protein QOJ46_2811 [bacterium]